MSLIATNTNPSGYGVQSLCYVGGYVYAYMYQYGIAKYNTSGGLVSTMQNTNVLMEAQMSTYVAARNTIYTPNGGTRISTYNLTTNTFVGPAFYPAEGPLALATDGSYLYVATNGGNGKINKCDFSLNVITDGFIPAYTVTTGTGSGSGSRSMVCDGSYLYQGDYYGVRRINIATKVVEKNWISGLTLQDPLLEIQSNYLYVTELTAAPSQTELIKVYELATGLYVQTINYIMVDPSGNWRSSPTAITTDGTNIYTINMSDPGTGLVSHLYKSFPTNTTGGSAPVITRVGSSLGTSNSSIEITFNRSGTYPLPITTYYSLDNGSTYINAGSAKSPLLITGLSDQSYNVLVKVNSANGNTAASNVVAKSSFVPGLMIATTSPPGYPVSSLCYAGGYVYAYMYTYGIAKYDTSGTLVSTLYGPINLESQMSTYIAARNTIYTPVHGTMISTYNLTTNTYTENAFYPATGPWTLATDGSYLYVGVGSTGKINKYDFSMNLITDGFISANNGTDANGSNSMVCDGSYLYHGDAYGVRRINIATKVVEKTWISGLTIYNPKLAIQSNYLYVAEQNNNSQTNLIKVYELATGLYVQTINYRMVDPSSNVSPSSFTTDGTNLYTINNSDLGQGAISHFYKTTPANTVGNAPVISSVPALNRNGLAINFTRSGTYPVPTTSYYSLDNGATYVNANSLTSPIFITNLADQSYNVLLKVNSPSGNTAASSVVTGLIATGRTTVFYARPSTDNYPAALIFINGTLYTFDGQYQYYKYPNYPSYTGRTSFTSTNYIAIDGSKTIGYSSSKNTIYYVRNYNVASYNLTTDTLNTSFITPPVNCAFKDMAFTGTFFYCLDNNNGGNCKIDKYDASGNVVTLNYYTGLPTGAELLTYDGSRYLYYTWQSSGTTQQNIGKLDTQSVSNNQNLLTGVISVAGYGVSRVYAEPTGTYIYSNTDISGNGILRMNKYNATGSTASLVSSTPLTISGTNYAIGNNFIYNNGYVYVPGNDALYEVAIDTVAPSTPSISTITATTTSLTINYSLSTLGVPPPIDFYYSLDGGSTYVDANSVSSPLVITGLSSGATYNVKLVSKNYVGNTAASAAVAQSTLGVGNPPVINSVTAVANSGFAIYFTPGVGGIPAPSTYYYSLDNGSTFTDASSTASPIYTTTGLGNQVYQVVLKAGSAAGNTSVSNTVFQTVQPSTNFNYNVTSASGTIGVYLAGSGSAQIIWGDGSSTSTGITATPQQFTHTYTLAGSYTVFAIGPTITRVGGPSASTGISYMTAVNSFGTSGTITDLSGLLAGSVNVSLPSSIPPAVTSLNSLFLNATVNDTNVNLWDVSNVSVMSSMFNGATIGSGVNLANWRLKSLTSAALMFTGSNITTAATDKLLNGWSTQTMQTGVALGLASYSNYSQYAVNKLTSSYNWTVTGNAVNYAISYVNLANRFKLTYTNSLKTPTAGKTYSLYSDLSGSSALSTYTAQAGDASFNFPNVANFAYGISTLRIVDGSSNPVDTVNLDTTSVLTTHSISNAFSQIGITLTGSGSALVNWGDGLTTSVTLSATATEYLHTYSTAGEYLVNTSGSGITQLGPGTAGISAMTGIQYLTSVISYGNGPITSLVGLLRGSTNAGVPTYIPKTVTNLGKLFAYATINDPNINLWDVSGVTGGLETFNTATFNNAAIDVTAWNVKSLQNANSMFYNSNFNQDLSNWKVSALQTASNMFGLSSVSTAQTDNLLTKWSTLSLQTGVTLGLNTYSLSSKVARDLLTSTYTWTITGTLVYQSLVYQNLASGYTFINTAATNPIAGHTYSLTSNLSATPIATYAAQAGDASYIFQNIASIPSGLKSLIVNDLSTNAVVNSVNLDTALTTLTYSIPNGGAQIGVWLAGSGNAVVRWGDGSYNNVSLSGTAANVLHTYAATGSYMVDISGAGITQVGQGVSSSPVATGIQYLTSVVSFGAGPITSLAGMLNSSSNIGLPAYIPSTVTNLGQLFYGATINDPDINSWDVSGVTNAQELFNGATFNNAAVNVANLNFIRLTNVNKMFFNALNFDGDLTNWNLVAVTDASGMFTGSSLSSSNADKLLSYLASKSLQSTVTLGIGRRSVYSNASVTTLTNSFGWTVTGNVTNYTPVYRNVSTNPIFSFVYSTPAGNPVAGRTYTLINNLSQTPIASYVAQGGDVSYNFNLALYTGGVLTLKIVDTSGSVVVDMVNFTSYTVCFKSDSKILCLVDDAEKYVPVQNLRSGDLVKTYLHGYVPIHMIGKKQIYHAAEKERLKDQLYKCSKSKFPELFEDLMITGCHSLLVDQFKNEEQRAKAVEVNGGRLFLTDNKFRVPACVDDRTSVYDKKGEYTIYHFSLENESYYGNYGVYANGLLVETCSKRFLKELSSMEILQ